MQLKDMLKDSGNLDKARLSDSELVGLILKLVNASKEQTDVNRGQVYVVRAVHSHKYKTGEKERAIPNNHIIGQLFNDELYKTDTQRLESELTQICKHADKIIIEISGKNVSENFNLEYSVQH